MLNKIMIGATLLCATGFASAATVTFAGSEAIATTENNGTIMITQFDSAAYGGAILDSVMLSFSGVLEGDAKVQSLNATASTITTTISGTSTLMSVADGGTLVNLSLAHTIMKVFNAGAYTGTPLFTAPSGIDYGTTVSSLSNPTQTFTGGDMAMFMGASTVDFDFAGTGLSIAAASGNVVSQFATRAGGSVSVTYTYHNTPPPVTGVSAPSHVAFLGLGLLAFAGLRKARK